MPAKKTAKKAAQAPKRLIVTAEGLNVREAPTLQAKVVDILTRDDIVDRISTSGDGYFHKITHNGNEGWASHKYLQFVTTPAPASNFPWFEIAHNELGVKEVTGSGDNPRIVAYHRSTTLDAHSASNDETPWCSSLMNCYVVPRREINTDSIVCLIVFQSTLRRISIKRINSTGRTSFSPDMHKVGNTSMVNAPVAVKVRNLIPCPEFCFTLENDC